MSAPSQKHLTRSDSKTLNPFPGLRPFKIEESHLFFGREGQGDEVLQKLSENRFVGIIGPSGSGKSSFVYCGVLPVLYGGFMTNKSPNWEVIITRPGSSPIVNIAESLLLIDPEYNNSTTEDKKLRHTIVTTLLRSSSLGLIEAIQQSRKDKDVNYLILVDQFEELFRFKDSSNINEVFSYVNLLISAINYLDIPVYVAITMRSDFIGNCAQFNNLTAKINSSHYLIPQITREQKRRAIESPIAVYGSKISPRLTQQLLNDLGDNPDQLPILQHALMRTWSFWKRFRDFKDEVIDLKHYEGVGTMNQALSLHANEAFDELDSEQQRICEVMFKTITEKRGDNFGVRRPTQLSEIAEIADVSESDLITVIDKFREHGRSLVTPEHHVVLSSKSMIDISHESLMRIWVRLKNWVDDESESVQMYLRLAETAYQYQIGKASLWRPPDLMLALNWQTKHRPTLVWGQRYHPAFERTMVFLEYSKNEWETEQRIKELEQKRRLKLARTTSIVFGTLALIALIALVYAYFQQTAAKKAQLAAESYATDAIRQKALAENSAKIAQQETKSANLARQAAVESQQEAERQRIIAIQNARLAENNSKRALSLQKLAESNADLAKKNELEANIQKDEAVKARNDALRLRYLAIGKSMAIKSKELNNDFELEALVAQQAFNFNKLYKGSSYDNDIYNGLYYSLDNPRINAPITHNLTGHIGGAARVLISQVATNEIYSGGSDGRILSWTLKNGTWNSDSIAEGRDTYQVYSMALSKDGKWLVAGGQAKGDITNNYLELYNLKNKNAPPSRIYGFNHAIQSIKYSDIKNGVFILNNTGMSIKFTNFSSVTEVIVPKEKINKISLNKDGSLLVGAGDSGTLFVWDVKNDYAEITYLFEQAKLTSVVFSPDGKNIVFGDESGLVRIITLGTNDAPRLLSGHLAHIEEIMFNHSGTFLVSTSRDRTVRLWNWNNLNEQPIKLDDHQDWVWSATFSPDDEQLLVGIHSNSDNPSKTIHIWPTNLESMSNLLCSYVTRNMTKNEWETFVAEDLPYENTCTVNTLSK